MRSESLLPKSLVISAHTRAGTVRVGCGGGGARGMPRTVVVTAGRRGLCRQTAVAKPPFMPASTSEPDGWTQPSGSSAIMRLARIDLPEPGPPHSSRKNETSWNLRTCVRVGVGAWARGRVGAWVRGYSKCKPHGSKACTWHSSISLTSRPAMLTPLEKRRIRNARWWPKGVRSVATSDCPCACPTLAVPRPVGVVRVDDCGQGALRCGARCDLARLLDRRVQAHLGHVVVAGRDQP